MNIKKIRILITTKNSDVDIAFENENSINKIMQSDFKFSEIIEDAIVKSTIEKDESKI